MKRFKLYKLGRKANPEYQKEGNVLPGIQMCGCSSEVLVPTDEAIEWAIKYRSANTDEEKEILREERFNGGLFDFDRQWESQEDLQPKIGWPIYCRSNRLDAGWVRTSNVRSYYKHGADSSEHPDKFILPMDFPREDLIHLGMPNMNEGDYLIATANSIYYLESIKE